MRVYTAFIPFTFTVMSLHADGSSSEARELVEDFKTRFLPGRIGYRFCTTDRRKARRMSRRFGIRYKVRG